MIQLPVRGFFVGALLMLAHTAVAANIYFSDARNGQTATYRLLGQMLQEKDSSFHIVQLDIKNGKAQARTMRAGDTLLVNIYAEDYNLLDKLKRYRKNGIQVLIDVEITGPQHFAVLDSQWFTRFREFPLVTGSRTVADAIKDRWPEVQPTVIPHLETLHYSKSIDAAESLFSQAGIQPEQKRILLIHQYPDWGEEFVERFFSNLDATEHPPLQVVLALHPHTSATREQKLREKYGQRSDVQIVVSTQGIKTNDLFPVIDGVVSHSSTLADVALESGLPVFQSQMGQDFSQLGAFIESLDPNSRSVREEHLRQVAADTLEKWATTLPSQRSVRANQLRACAEVFGGASSPSAAQPSEDPTSSSIFSKAKSQWRQWFGNGFLGLM